MAASVISEEIQYCLDSHALQPSAGARVRVMLCRSVPIGTVFSSVGREISGKDCKIRTTAYDASKRANSSAQIIVSSRSTGKMCDGYERPKQIRGPPLKGR